MQVLNTIISSNPQIIGERICEECGSKIPIIKIKDREASHCLVCENNRLQKQCQTDFEKSENERNEVMFRKYSIIPDDLQNANLSGYKPLHHSQLDALRLAMEYKKNFKQIKNGEWNYHSLLLQGSYGVGKSHLAYSIAQEILKKGNVVIFIDVPQLLQLFRDNIKSKENSEQEIMKYISKADLLVLDDMGAEYIKYEFGKESWAVDKLFQIFSLRNNKPKIMTTNYDSKGLQEKYGHHGGRIVSRMLMGTKVVKMEGRDYRIKQT